MKFILDRAVGRISVGAFSDKAFVKGEIHIGERDLLRRARQPPAARVALLRG